MLHNWGLPFNNRVSFFRKASSTNLIPNSRVTLGAIIKPQFHNRVHANKCLAIKSAYSLFIFHLMVFTKFDFSRDTLIALQKGWKLKAIKSCNWIKRAFMLEDKMLWIKITSCSNNYWWDVFTDITQRRLMTE